MIAVEQIVQWLKGMGEEDAAGLMTDCTLQFRFVNLFCELSGNRDWEVFDVEIETPPKWLKLVRSTKKDASVAVEQAIRDCTPADSAIRDIRWVGQVPHVPTPDQERFAELIADFDAPHLQAAWRKALERKTTDPDGALTAARTLLETACKYVLDHDEVAYDDKADGPVLFARAAAHLGLSPKQQGAESLRKVLGACQAIVQGLCELRNQLGDAHGKRANAPSVEPEQAEFAVNVAGALSTFLLSMTARTGTSSVDSQPADETKAREHSHE
ncbi:MAG: abortive infection family protein [Myxococcota bacterium]|nr:abortive infection family protein [Myxococcota bacterium]